MTTDLRDLLLLVVTMVTIAMLIRRSSMTPRRRKGDPWHFSLQSLMIYITLTSILFGVLAALLLR
jgi:galactitol-specific phosphotransferase system IIC component